MNVLNPQFRVRIFHESPTSPRIKKYALIESSPFLCTLSNLPKLALGGTLQLSDSDYTFLGRLMILKQNILSVIKVMKSRVSKNDNEEPDSGRVGQNRQILLQKCQKKTFF